MRTPRLAGGAGGLRPHPQAAQRIVEVGGRRAPRRRPVDARGLGRAPGHDGRRAARRPARAGGRAAAVRRRRVRRPGAVVRAGRRDLPVVGRRPSRRWPAESELRAALLAEIGHRRAAELDRGISLVGPHRDELELVLGPGWPGATPRTASRGRSRSPCGIGSFELLRSDGVDPVLVLDDVFAELDVSRRTRLAGLVADADQVLITAAVDDDVPGCPGSVRRLPDRVTVRSYRNDRVVDNPVDSGDNCEQVLANDARMMTPTQDARRTDSGTDEPVAPRADSDLARDALAEARRRNAEKRKAAGRTPLRPEVDTRWPAPLVRGRSGRRPGPAAVRVPYSGAGSIRPASAPT